MSTPVIRARSVDDLVRAVPHLLGFHPSASLVVGCLSGDPKRVGLVIRVDLPPPGDERALARQLARVVAEQSAGAAFALCFDDGHVGTTSEDRPLPWSRLVDALERALADRGVELVEADLVGDGRRWSYTCQQECCPPGALLEPADEGAVGLLAAEQALSGRSPLPDRAALSASVRPAAATGVRSALSRARLQRARRSYALLAAGGRAQLVAHVCSLVGHAAAALGQTREPDPDWAALVLVSLRDVWVRDAVLTLALDAAGEGSEAAAQPGEDRDGGAGAGAAALPGGGFSRAALVSVLVALAQQAPEAEAAPVCSLLAGTAYAFGDGALANVALERALGAEPGYSLAALLDRMFAAATTPEELRRVLRDVRADLAGALDAVPPTRVG
ncbi:uncharacterized protein DUF4192 [Motilibacter peucedani]|uniref:Uncharacterized protein DUF4192 n=1 Tax=Motilibacter peucedani TaxID=598650 RepID=A0A420XRK6_9ACTN|nr:DUF4192 domain-containing protein [Motilibacter peucedani]RKS77536.1 uncharacterized protein DUF4192 [Motilibacter peucedani]